MLPHSMNQVKQLKKYSTQNPNKPDSRRENTREKIDNKESYTHSSVPIPFPIGTQRA